MFNRKDVSSEIENSMEKVLVSNAVDKETENLSKLAGALEHLNAAAEIFDTVGLRKHAEATTMLLESFAAKKKKKKTKSKSKQKSKSKSKSSPAKKPDPATKDLTSEKMVDNLAHKGWVFNADDGMDENSADDNYARHGHDCMCSMCMDVDDVNDMKLGITSGPGLDDDSPGYWEHMAKKYMQKGDFRKAEEAMMHGIRARDLARYDAQEELSADDFNFDLDYMSADDPEDDDFEDEVDMRPKHTMLPPAMEDDEEMPPMKPYRSHSGEWNAIENTQRPTMPAIPSAKKHRKEIEDEFDDLDYINELSRDFGSR